MKPKILLITPPFTQLNTPYPATVFLKGFLNTLKVESKQADLGIECILELFSQKCLSLIFMQLEGQKSVLSDQSRRILLLKEEYLNTIDPVIAFLQNKKPSLANLICSRNYIPEGNRFTQIDDLEWAFGTMGNLDKARYLATLYLEDIGDLIVETIDPHFGFSRYAEHLGRYAYEFDELDEELNKTDTFIDRIVLELLESKICAFEPDLMVFTIPFPGNLYSSLKCGKWIKEKHPNVKVAMGGGFVNTELRSLNDKRIFKYTDYICLDDGELPLQCVIEHICGNRRLTQLKRTFVLDNDLPVFCNEAQEEDYDPENKGIPDYSGLLLEKYISVIEVTNPMHSLWSNGRWNKLMLAHGCYWAKCSFCDTSLDYIKRYRPLKVRNLVNQIESLINQTGESGFHFVDEAAPPALLRELALEILRRRLSIVWWTNIRFEKNYSYDLCRLLSEAGCIAVSGGIEVASDRILKLINKGVDIQQASKSMHNFSANGIMVHSYLMYGFPTQNEQETIDSLEIVRQMFEQGIIHSAYWHRFALTVHSYISQNPDYYKIKPYAVNSGSFANNDLEYTEVNPINHEKFANGLKISVHNFMNGLGFDIPLHKWFDFKIPKTTISPDFIEDVINNSDFQNFHLQQKIIWTGGIPQLVDEPIKGKQQEMVKIKFYHRKNDFFLKLDKCKANWLLNFLEKISISSYTDYTIQKMKEDFEKYNNDSFMLFLHSKSMDILRRNGLLIV